MEKITALEILQMQAEGKKMLCIDLREGYRHAQLDAGGLRVSYKDLAQHRDYLLAHADATFVLCCVTPRQSGRTQHAETILRGLGLQDIRELANGIVAGWAMLWGQSIPNKTKLPLP